MRITWIARKHGCRALFCVFNMLNDIEYRQAIDWRINRISQGYTVKSKA